MESCFPAKQQSAEEERRSCPHFAIMPFSFPVLNFKQPLRLNSSSPLLVGTSNAVREVQKSISCNVDKYLKILEESMSRNGVVDKLMSISSRLQKGFFQIPRRKWEMVPNSRFAAIIPGDSVAGVVVANGVLNFLNIYNTLLIVRLVLTWFPTAPPAIVSPLSTLCDPYLNIFRGIIPPLGGLDLSPILAFLVLNAFTSTASALPAELPTSQASQPHLTSSADKWMRRLSGKASTH